MHNTEKEERKTNIYIIFNRIEMKGGKGPSLNVLVYLFIDIIKRFNRNSITMWTIEMKLYRVDIK